MPFVVSTTFFGGGRPLNILQKVANLQRFKKSYSELDSSCNFTVLNQNVGLVM